MFVLFSMLATKQPGSDPTTQEQIQKLVQAAQQGSQTAMLQIYRLYVHRLFRVLRPMCHNDDDAEDLVQESFVKAFQAIGRYHPQEGVRFVSWLLRIATNTAQKKFRRQRKFRTLPPESLDALREEHETSSNDPAGDALDFQQKRTALLQALQELQPQQQQVLTLRYGAELSAQEVAQICGLQEAHVRKICQRLRDRLLNRLQTLLADPVAQINGSSAVLLETQQRRSS